MSRDRYHVFGALRLPGAPPELRERSLAAARAAVEAAEPTEAPRETLTDRLWTSRPLRFAWAASVVALVGVNVWMDAGSAAPSTARLEEALMTRVGEREPADRPWTLLAARDGVLRALLAEESGVAERKPAGRSARRAS